MVCHLNLCIKKWGSPCSFRKKSPFISLNNPVFIENLQVLSATARACTNHTKSDAQKGCAIQLNGITFRIL